MGHMSVRLSTYDGGTAEEFLLNLIMENSIKFMVDVSVLPKIS
jgi:hypothetical protein